MPGHRPDTTVRVVSFNVRNGLSLDGRHSWPFRRHATAAVLGGLQPDVACLQEVFGFQLRGLRRRLPGTVAAGAPRRDGRWRGERCPVLLRGGHLRLRSARTRWFGEEPDRPGGRLPGSSFPRVATLAVVEDRRGRSFGVASTHLDERLGANRVRAARQLLTWLDPDLPWIVGGDLNAGPASATLTALARGGLRPVHPGGGPGTAHGFTGRLDGPRIDHVLVTSHWSVEDAWVDHQRPGGRLPSDHWPVVADVTLAPA